MTSDLQNTVIYLLGFPGTGKLTIAQELCKNSDKIRLLDNHAVNNLVFPLVREDGASPLPEAIWKLTEEIRKTVLKGLVEIGRRDFCFIMTNALFDDDPTDQRIYKQTLDASEQGGYTFVPVRLLLTPEENRRRIVSPEREKRMKMTSDYNVDEWHADDEIIHTNHPNELTVDITSLSPTEAANFIIRHVSELQSKFQTKSDLTHS